LLLKETNIRKGARTMAKILVVNDQPHIVRLIQTNLEREGYEVVTAYDGVEALERVEEEKPDLIILDDQMPRMDGFGVLCKLQSDPGTANIPVIMLADGDADRDSFKGWQAGINAYLTKPFNPRELLVFVKRNLKEEGCSDGEGDPLWPY
jgi:two-component system alkaline phosphatase synthesis response regulator PhoP/two-component system response regulator VicR